MNIVTKMFQLLNDSICLGLRYSQHLYNFISFNKQTFSHVLNLLNRDKVSSPFTDSEFQRGKIQPVSKIFGKIFDLLLVSWCFREYGELQ